MIKLEINKNLKYTSPSGKYYQLNNVRGVLFVFHNERRVKPTKEILDNVIVEHNEIIKSYEQQEISMEK